MSRPQPLEVLQRDAMHQVPGTRSERRQEALRTLASAREFRKSAELALEQRLKLPAISSLHEASRLAISAQAASNGFRFSNRGAAHVAVVDYALALKLVDRTEWAQLDELRDLRHKANYPSDLIEPTNVEIDQFKSLADTVIGRSQNKIAPIPPPPKPEIT